jgi:hypothetical protein
MKDGSYSVSFLYMLKNLSEQPKREKKMKRKNLKNYHPEAAEWDKVLGMDSNGNWDEEIAVAKVASIGNKAAVEALKPCVNAIIESFKTNASCPAFDMAMNLIDEAYVIGVDTGDLADSVQVEWRMSRKNQREES